MTAPPAHAFPKAAEAFRSYARRNFDAPLPYTFDAVAIVDGIIEECHEALKGMASKKAWTFLNNLTLGGGAFVGEVLVRSCGGTWQNTGDGSRLQDWIVSCPDGHGGSRRVPVFDAFYRGLANGAADTLLALVAPFLTNAGKWPTTKRVARTRKGNVPRAIKVLRRSR